VKRALFLLVISALLLTGCSSSDTKIDPVEYEAWQACIDKYVADMAGYYKNNNDLFDDAIEACKKLTPRN
jgi:major membrane immunogen (membrane-anchored lipoprotein)